MKCKIKKWIQDIRMIVLLEAVLLCAALSIMLLETTGWLPAGYFIDIPSLLGILIITIPCLCITGEWKHFLNAFTIGKKDYELLQLKNICEAVSTCQKLVAYSGILEILVSFIIITHELKNPEWIGANVGVALLSCFYLVVLEILLLPLSVCTKRKLNEEIDMDYEDMDYEDTDQEGYKCGNKLSTYSEDRKGKEC